MLCIKYIVIGSNNVLYQKEPIDRIKKIWFENETVRGKRQSPCRTGSKIGITLLGMWFKNIQKKCIKRGSHMENPCSRLIRIVVIDDHSKIQAF
jgi:hypothetical protein